MPYGSEIKPKRRWTRVSTQVGLMRPLLKLLGYVIKYSIALFYLLIHRSFFLCLKFVRTLGFHRRGLHSQWSCLTLLFAAFSEPTLVDADDPNATMFSPGSVPVVTSPKRTVWFPDKPQTRNSPLISLSQEIILLWELQVSVLLAPQPLAILCN